MVKKLKFGKLLDQQRISIYGEYFQTEFENKSLTAYTPSELRSFHSDKKLLAITKQLSLSFSGLISYLLDRGLLRELDIKEINRKLYLTKHFDTKSDIFRSIEVARKLYHKGYLCYYTAMYLNNLTEQIPKLVCINVEQRVMYNIENARSELSQERISRAFEKTIERGQSIAILDFKIRKTSGKETRNAGVERQEIGGMNVPVTNVERTLIDIIIRPELSGGITEVLQAYRTAISTNKVSLKKMIQYIKQIDYVYPYYQAIGFLLSTCGYEQQQLSDYRREFSIKYDFYLIHGSVNKKKNDLNYNQDWRIFFPKYLL